MTKEEIITRLQNAAKEDEEYHMDDDLIDAINEYPEPFELILGLILVCRGILFIF